MHFRYLLRIKNKKLLTLICINPNLLLMLSYFLKNNLTHVFKRTYTPMYILNCKNGEKRRPSNYLRLTATIRYRKKFA